MTTMETTGGSPANGIGFLDRSRIIAKPGFYRWLVPPAAEHHHMSEEEAAAEKKLADDTHQHFIADVEALGEEVVHSWKVTQAWAIVWIPLGWGIWITLSKALVLFR